MTGMMVHWLSKHRECELVDGGWNANTSETSLNNQKQLHWTIEQQGDTF
jgi:hypothetical protein